VADGGRDRDGEEDDDVTKDKKRLAADEKSSAAERTLDLWRSQKARRERDKAPPAPKWLWGEVQQMWSLALAGKSLATIERVKLSTGGYQFVASEGDGDSTCETMADAASWVVRRRAAR
jgi:hypothetical protein